MAVYKEQIELQSHGERPTYLDITPQVKKAIEHSGIKEGICVAISPHTTCSVFFEEFVHDCNEDGDEFLQEDLNHALEKIIPNQTDWGQYAYPGEKHFEEVFKWPDIENYIPGGDKTKLFNCDAHLRSTILGSSETFEVSDGKLGVGKTGYIYFVDFDRAQPRKRRCRIVIIGE